MSDSDNDHSDGSDGSDDENPSGSGSRREKSKRELPPGAVQVLKQWLLNPVNFAHPYPSSAEQSSLMQRTGVDKKQLKNWFTNARRRIWKPMIRQHGVDGALAAATAKSRRTGGLGTDDDDDDDEHNSTRSNSPVPTLPKARGRPPAKGDANANANANVNVNANANANNNNNAKQGSAPNPTNWGWAAEHQQMLLQQEQQLRQLQQQQQQQYNMHGSYYNGPHQHGGGGGYGRPSAPPGGGGLYHLPPPPITHTHSIGTLNPNMYSSSSSSGSGSVAFYGMAKNDSHALLMELFAHDQELVQNVQQSKYENYNKSSSFSSSSSSRATNPPQQSAPPPPPPPSSFSSRGAPPPEAGSWPNLGSVGSLSNLVGNTSSSSSSNGPNLTTVRSMNSLSQSDLALLAGKRMGGTGGFKSSDDIGNADSYAFLELFFDDKASSFNAGSGGTPIALGKSASGAGLQRAGRAGSLQQQQSDYDVGLSLDAEDDGHRDSTAPRRKNSREYSSAHTSNQQSPEDSSSSTTTATVAAEEEIAARGLVSVSRSSENLTDLDLPKPMQRSLSQEAFFNRSSMLAASHPYGGGPAASGANGSDQQQQPVRLAPASDSVLVPASSICAICGSRGVDTQLRPCGCVFHTTCLKQTFARSSTGTGRFCPVDNSRMQSVVVAIVETPQMVAKRTGYGAGEARGDGSEGGAEAGQPLAKKQRQGVN